ncbi:PP2C family protein-serine/threonine phosphatase, partial [Jatrophihabitans sp.]|uniref:PP2C family protein-serine/threonine phosphatase n=1 Tax=Jatrophihabitans sp. TaxID=1932789 RepID=UPI0030C6D6FC|nr:Two-component sensor protein [Jatrophihabitans sp.]
RERGVTRWRWSNAGHPPPMVLNPDGTVAVLGGVSADLLLGIDPGTERVESEVTLDRGSTVLLYTDGLVERTDEDLDESLARLALALAGTDSWSLDDICDWALSGRRNARRDDIALLAFRLTGIDPR